eukprot:TRINITY_DN5159_c0_g2_i3.p1 TRINITY_DN5159_c0_g2~~TRINITY_DN5159_c0_g2_i3.p1  ORF type:complete len:181 (-),score=51.70 TRINITY_DN5159_c0_g2_i3:84-626(-)
MTSLQSKIQMFNKPNINADEEMKIQAKKAKFLAKLSKFENLNTKPEEKPSKAEVSKKAKMFETGQTVEEDDMKERELRKLSFDLIKQQFEGSEETLQESDSSGFGSIEDISSTTSQTPATAGKSADSQPSSLTGTVSPPPPVFADEPTPSAAAENFDRVVDKTTELSLKTEDIESKSASE